MVAVRTTVMDEGGDIASLEDGERINSQPVRRSQSSVINICLQGSQEVVCVVLSLNVLPQNLCASLVEHFFDCKRQGLGLSFAQL